MNEHTAVRIKGTLWQAIVNKASKEKVSPEEWLQHRLNDVIPKTAPSASEDDLLLDLAIRHFRELDLTSGEARDLSAAILETAATGVQIRVGPVGRTSRCYELHRRVAAVTIRVGEGRIKLPLQAALRLANALKASCDSQPLHDIAA